MALLSWSDKYRIGNETIDAEHRYLFHLINEFHDSWQAAQRKQDIAHVLIGLVRYAEEHFQHEEAIMAAAGFPPLAAHHAEHERMCETIFKLQQEYEQEDRHLEQDTVRFVRKWLVDHIVADDYLFRDFLARPKAAEPAATPEASAQPAPEGT